MHERFESSAELGGGFAHGLGDGVGDSAVAGEHDDDAVGFAEFLGAEDEGVVSEVFWGAHGFMFVVCEEKPRILAGG